MGRSSYTPSYFLFARPSFWGGLAQVLDLGDTMFEYNVSLTPEQADYFAMKADWLAVGMDLRHALAEADVEGVRPQPQR